ncbi:MAG: ABC transporter ATP-binding protein [Gammaproteobacteria bacterium]
MNNSSSSILSCDNLHKIFHDGKRELSILRGASLAIQPGEQVAIVGVSGAGKSTLLHILGGLDAPTKGVVKVAGKNIHALSEGKRCRLRNQKLGFVYQMHHLLPEFTVMENVMMPLFLSNTPTAKHKEETLALLEAVGLGDRIHHKMGALSGGERQRTAIARALVTKPACVLADEPTGNLDETTAHTVYETMLNLRGREGTAFLIVTHDRRFAASMDRVLSLEKGALVAS